MEQTLHLPGSAKKHNKKSCIRDTPTLSTAISRPSDYVVYKLASNMPKSEKSRKPLQDEVLSLLLINQNKILKRGMTWTEQKPKVTTFKMQPIAYSKSIIY